MDPECVREMERYKEEEIQRFRQNGPTISAYHKNPNPTIITTYRRPITGEYFSVEIPDVAKKIAPKDKVPAPIAQGSTSIALPNGKTFELPKIGGKTGSGGWLAGLAISVGILIKELGLTLDDVVQPLERLGVAAKIGALNSIRADDYNFSLFHEAPLEIVGVYRSDGTADTVASSTVGGATGATGMPDPLGKGPRGEDEDYKTPTSGRDGVERIEKAGGRINYFIIYGEGGLQRLVLSTSNTQPSNGIVIVRGTIEFIARPPHGSRPLKISIVGLPEQTSDPEAVPNRDDRPLVAAYLNRFFGHDAHVEIFQ